MKKYLPLMAGLISQVIFGIVYIFIKTGMSYVNQDAVKFLAFRFSIGFIAMTLLILLGFFKVNYKNKPFWMILLVGAMNPLISQVCETTSTTYAPTSIISIFNSLGPLAILFFSVILNHEFPTKKQWFFVLLTVAGLLVINSRGLSAAGLTLKGLLLCIGTVVMVGMQRTYLRRVSVHFSAFEIIYITTGMGAVCFSAYSLIKNRLNGGTFVSFFDGLGEWPFIMSVLYMGIFSSVIGFTFMAYSTANLPIAVCAATNTVCSVIGIAVGILFFKEGFHWTELLGVAIILFSVVGISTSYNASDTESNRFHGKAKRQA